MLGLLNEDLWLANLVLNVFAVRPMYVWLSLVSLVVTVAWYIIDLVRHCPCTGQLFGCLQLHFLATLSSFTFVKIDLLCPSMVVFTLLIQH